MMRIEGSEVLIVIVIGVGATLCMDIWNRFLNHRFNIPSLNYCLLGRWVRHMPDGSFRHVSISAAAPKSGECAAGWITHYMIGVGLTFGFALLTSEDWLARPTLLPALLYGIVTVVFPFFIMQPSLGLGVASSKTANPTHARLKSLATHAVFGLGLYVCAVATTYVLNI